MRAAPPASLTTTGMRRLLSDHEGAPDSLCRHLHPGVTSKTVFWCVADVTDGDIRYGRGNPCEPGEQRYVFDAWPGH
jgi:hypothetical protein